MNGSFNLEVHVSNVIAIFPSIFYSKSFRFYFLYSNFSFNNFLIVFLQGTENLGEMKFISFLNDSSSTTEKGLIDPTIQSRRHS